MVNSAFDTNQVQSTLARAWPPVISAIQMQAAHVHPSSHSTSLHWSVIGLRFAHLNSQGVGVLQARRPSRRCGPVLHQSATYCEANPRSVCFHSVLVRRSLRSAFFPSAPSVRFSHQRPNPSVEGMAKRLRLLSTPHLKR
jgi:hypothetical protein